MAVDKFVITIESRLEALTTDAIAIGPVETCGPVPDQKGWNHEARHSSTRVRRNRCMHRLEHRHAARHSHREGPIDRRHPGYRWAITRVQYRQIEYWADSMP